MAVGSSTHGSLVSSLSTGLLTGFAGWRRRNPRPVKFFIFSVWYSRHVARDPCACADAGTDRLWPFLFWLLLVSAIFGRDIHLILFIIVHIPFEVLCLRCLVIGKRCRQLLIFPIHARTARTPWGGSSL